MEVEREDGRVCEVEDVVMESLCTMIEIKIVTCKSLSLSLSLSPRGLRGTVPWEGIDSVGTPSSSSISDSRWSKVYLYLLLPEHQVKLTFSTCGDDFVRGGGGGKKKKKEQEERGGRPFEKSRPIY